MDYIVHSNIPGQRQTTCVRIDGVAREATAIRRARKIARWPEGAIITTEVVEYTPAERAAAATRNYYGPLGLSDPG